MFFLHTEIFVVFTLVSPGKTFTRSTNTFLLLNLKGIFIEHDEAMDTSNLRYRSVGSVVDKCQIVKVC